jgi:hypothetical protein
MDDADDLNGCQLRPTNPGTRGEIPTGIVERADAVLTQLSDSGGQSSKKGNLAALDGVDDLRKRGIEFLDGLIGLIGANVLPANVTGGLARGPALASSGVNGAQALPVVAPVAPAKAGEVAEVIMRVANGGSVHLPLGLIATDLISGSGNRIPSSSLSFRGEKVGLGPGATLPVAVVVKLPLGTAPGAYWGLLQVVGQPNTRALLAVNVE